MGRRIRKTTNDEDTAFVYDGWNVIAEYDVTSTPTLDTTYTWGMDLSGSMQGAGGVGGLFAVNDGTNTFYPTYDGNGNVSEYLNASGTNIAHYEYDAFGNIVKATGNSEDFRYRFSTKPLDEEIGWYYYGYRYYDPQTGRWPSRDPIEEQGGINLYGFVGNDGVKMWDRLGLSYILIKVASNKEIVNDASKALFNERVKLLKDELSRGKAQMARTLDTLKDMKDEDLKYMPQKIDGKDCDCGVDGLVKILKRESESQVIVVESGGEKELSETIKSLNQLDAVKNGQIDAIVVEIHNSGGTGVELPNGGTMKKQKIMDLLKGIHAGKNAVETDIAACETYADSVGVVAQPPGSGFGNIIIGRITIVEIIDDGGGSVTTKPIKTLPAPVE